MHVQIDNAQDCNFSVWFQHLKTENYCLKICIEICIDEKVL